MGSVEDDWGHCGDLGITVDGDRLEYRSAVHSAVTGNAVCSVNIEMILEELCRAFARQEK